MKFQTGEQPGKGTYPCTHCGATVTVVDDNEPLPPCPQCHQTEFELKAYEYITS